MFVSGRPARPFTGPGQPGSRAAGQPGSHRERHVMSDTGKVDYDESTIDVSPPA
ncbi:hypothetical protein NKH18_50555 [Streptomyces sp. M10(2022)]